MKQDGSMFDQIQDVNSKAKHIYKDVLKSS